MIFSAEVTDMQCTAISEWQKRPFDSWKYRCISRRERRICTRISHIYIIKRRALSGDVFSSAWALNPSYAFVYLFATFRCLLLTCVNQSCESEWCVDSHASVSIWLSRQLNGEMPELMPLDKWAGSAVAGEGNTLPTGGWRAMSLCDYVLLKCRIYFIYCEIPPQ